MKAIVHEKYGAPDVLQIKELIKPEQKENQVLIKVKASTVTLFDCWMRSCTAPPGFGFLMRIFSGKKPKQPILGTELSGVVESIGEKVTKFKTGDEIIAFLGLKLGAYAEYIVLDENSAIAKKPSNLSFEESAALQQGFLTADYFLQNAKIESGQKILIFGASGGVGLAAVQLAKYYGTEVTGVCSTSKIDFVKSIGADNIIDYTKDDFTKSEKKYDIVFDTNGKTPLLKTNQLLKKNGTYLLATFGLPKLFGFLWLKLTSKVKLFFGTLVEKSEDIEKLVKLAEENIINVPIDKIYSINEAPNAHAYVESGKKKGNVIISFNS